MTETDLQRRAKAGHAAMQAIEWIWKHPDHMKTAILMLRPTESAPEAVGVTFICESSAQACDLINSLPMSPFSPFENGEGQLSHSTGLVWGAEVTVTARERVPE